MDSKKIKIYSDGACSGNPGPGGWGALIIYNNQSKEIFGGMKSTTNNQMELKSIIEALKIVENNYKIEVYTDSMYVKDGITKWVSNWKKNGWKTSSKKPVKNMELWKELDQLNSSHKINWQWVKGHSGDIGNEKADALARKGIPKN
ncbi:ribonuclease HI [Alphaproteobacteria bacterium]|nr:ribonuclease HI [Alphaproteobacteria bacterium]